MTGSRNAFRSGATMLVRTCTGTGRHGVSWFAVLFSLMTSGSSANVRAPGAKGSMVKDCRHRRRLFPCLSMDAGVAFNKRQPGDLVSFAGALTVSVWPPST